MGLPRRKTESRGYIITFSCTRHEGNGRPPPDETVRSQGLRPAHADERPSPRDEPAGAAGPDRRLRRGRPVPPFLRNHAPADVRRSRLSERFRGVVQAVPGRPRPRGETRDPRPVLLRGNGGVARGRPGDHRRPVRGAHHGPLGPCRGRVPLQAVHDRGLRYRGTDRGPEGSPSRHPEDDQRERVLPLPGSLAAPAGRKGRFFRLASGRGRGVRAVPAHSRVDRLSSSTAWPIFGRTWRGRCGRWRTANEPPAGGLRGDRRFRGRDPVAAAGGEARGLPHRPRQFHPRGGRRGGDPRMDGSRTWRTSVSTPPGK